jgi:hypothetical protein
MCLPFRRFILSEKENPCYSLLFPVPADQFPVRAKTIPCFNLQGIRVQDIEINIRFNAENRQTAEKIANSLLFSLF